MYFQYDSIILNDGNNNDILYALLRSMPLHTYAHLIRILCLIWYCFLHGRFVIVSVCKSAVFLNWYIRSFYCYHITSNHIYNVYGLYTPNIINLYFLYAVKEKNPRILINFYQCVNYSFLLWKILCAGYKYLLWINYRHLDDKNFFLKANGKCR